MKEDEMSEKYKKALRLAAVMGCGFQGDAEDAAELLTLITGLESRIAELSQAVGLITTLKPTMVMDVDHPLDMAKEVEAYVTARIAELEKDNDEFRQLIHDWIIILTPDDGYVPDSECVRQAMLVIDKERER